MELVPNHSITCGQVDKMIDVEDSRWQVMATAQRLSTTLSDPQEAVASIAEASELQPMGAAQMSLSILGQRVSHALALVSEKMETARKLISTQGQTAKSSELLPMVVLPMSLTWMSARSTPK